MLAEGDNFSEPGNGRYTSSLSCELKEAAGQQVSRRDIFEKTMS
jgi:hypothetical protein